MPLPPSSKPHKPYSHGEPFPIADLSKKPTRSRDLSPRDAALLKALREAAAATESQVVPFYLGPDDKLATVKLAAKRLAKQYELPVSAGSHRSYPGTLLLTRGTLRRPRSG